MQTNNEKIKRFSETMSNNFLSTKIAFYLTKASLETLGNVNTIIKSFLEGEKASNGEVLLNIFGMLQGLFVGIDALYGLSYGITNRKWSVNVNSNPQLREIKYVRNDVVGHPTRRTYSENKIGYCVLDVEKTSYYNLVYKIAIPTEKTEDIQDHSVDLKKTIDSYYEESNKLLDEIYNRMLLEDPTKSEYFSEQVYLLFKDYRRGVRNINLLNDIKSKYRKIYNLGIESNDRFIWRINIIEELFNWDMDSHDEILAYLINYQIEKLYRMSNDFDELDFSGFELKYKIPNSVKTFTKLVHDNKIEKDILNDNYHPLFLQTLDHIHNLAKGNKVILKIKSMFYKNRNNQTRIYALGCML